MILRECTGQNGPKLQQAHPLSLFEMFGITGGTNWDSEIKKDSFPGRLFANARMFYLQEKDFEDQVPATYQPAAYREGARWGGFSENYYRSLNWKRRIPYLIHSWEKVGSWPDKWYRCEEWGDLEETIYNYTLNYLETFCPADTTKPCWVDLLEVGNEPWGKNTPGPACFHQLMETVIRAFRDYYGPVWRLPLSAPAFQNSQPDSPIHDYIDEMLPRSHLPYLQAISGHFYAFEKGTHKINQPPESPQGRFLELKDLVAWRDSVAPHLQVNLTETGWNSVEVGEKAQAAYLIRALLVAARYGVHRFIYYELYDQPKVPIYSSCGLIGPNKRAKESFLILIEFFRKYGNYHFQKVMQEEDVYIFQLRDDAKLLYLAWDSGPYQEDYRKVVFMGRTFEINGMPHEIRLK